jgi:hypothetical protein
MPPHGWTFKAGGELWVEIQVSIHPLTSNKPAQLLPGIFDTAASISWLQSSLQDDKDCVPVPVSVAAGRGVIYRGGVMLEADFEGHRFDLPVGFDEHAQWNLFGTIGLMDQFRIRFEPSDAWTYFDWTGPISPTAAGIPRAAIVGNRWAKERAKGNTWDAWKQNHPPRVGLSKV